ncbi:MAG: MarR family winged helix-turn-helix transcriptional regulator [Alphaproteobacteria bacterium]|nr:MarR family winged helix-turn-helix transcriptional regulator [Alphaproteobacteria bacterium]
MANRLSRVERDQCAQALATSACVNLRKSSRAITRWYDKELEPCGLRSTQLAILLNVAAVDRPTYSDVARELVTDLSTLSRNLAILEKQGLVRTEPGRDSRRKIIWLTVDGMNRIRKAIPLWARTQQAFLSQFGDKRWSEFLDGLGATISSAHDAENLPPGAQSESEPVPRVQRKLGRKKAALKT